MRMSHSDPELPSESFSFLRAIAVTLVVGGAVALGATLFYLHELGVFAFSKESIAKILNWEPDDNTVIYDRDGGKLGEVFSQYHIYYPYEKLPAGMVQAILAIEDRSFWSHIGIDPRGMARAAFRDITGTSRYRQGGSTITQQIVRNFLLTREKTIARKVGEIFLALKLESFMEKRKILEIYANSLFLGSGAYGVGAAAKRYFDKNLEELDVHEFAMIAGLFQSPSRYNPHKHLKRCKKRQLQVLRAMVANGNLSRRRAARYARRPLDIKPYTSMFGKHAPYFVDYAREQARSLLKMSSLKNQGLRVYTTLSPQVQELAEKAVAESTPLLEKYNKSVEQVRKDGKTYQPELEAALLAMDPRTGEITAMVGGRDYEKSQFNRTIQAKRQPGSGFKPIVYSLALSRGYKWSDLLYVSPITLAGHYRPRNAQKDYLTETTLLRAFYRSMNAPTMEVGQKLGVRRVIRKAREMGIYSEMKQEFGTLLGSSETTMLDMLRLYGGFANSGRLLEPIAIKEIQDKHGQILYKAPRLVRRSERVLSKAVNYLMVEGMRQVLIRGTGYKAAGLARWAAGKTGTSNDARDNWFNGFTTHSVAIVWVGTDEHVPVHGNANGSTLALPIWTRFMEQMVEADPPDRFHSPEGVQKLYVHPNYGRRTEDGIVMWFLDDLLPTGDEVPMHGISQARDFRDPFATR